MTENSGYSGQMRPSDAAGAYNAQLFIINQLLGKVNTTTLVRIIKCTNDGGLSSVGFVDVEPLVNQVDGQGNPVVHGVVYGLPYLRIQGGTDAIVMDPKPGDIGAAIFASRDISKVKATKDKALPGSGRKFSMSDGIYIGGLLNGIPQQYIQFQATGITVVSPQKVTVQSPVIELNASTSLTVNSPDSNFNGKITATGDITSTGGDVKAGAISLKTHKTSGVTPGGGTSNVPVP